MGTVSGDNYTKAVAGDPSDRVEAEWGGRLKAQIDNYEAASLATGSVINVGWLDPGEVFVAAYVKADDLSSAGTLALGIPASPVSDADHFMAATVFTTAGQATLAILNSGHKNETDDRQIICLTTATEEMTGTIETVIIKAGR
jgi:hypothetical protein